MAAQMRADDEIRLNILEAMMKKRSVVPNIRQLKHYTGYHLATIKSSVDFLEKQGVLEGFGPKVDFRKLGYKLEPIMMLQADMSEKRVFNDFLETARRDPHLYQLSAIIGSGNWNLIARFVDKDIESFHKNDEERYYKAVPGIFKLLRDRQIFYATEPLYKNASRTASLIELIRRDKGV